VLLVYLPWQQAPVQPLWQQVFPQSSPQHAPQHAAFNWPVWLNAIALRTTANEKIAKIRFI
jgi:hypothetical protein